MAVHWRLRSFLAKKGIFTATAFQKRILKKTGILISLQNLCNYMNRRPSLLRLKTIEIICTSLDCSLEDLCTVKPLKINEKSEKKLSFKNTPHAKRSLKKFPNPNNYE